MKTKFLLVAVMASSVLTMTAQETYENAKIAGEDLNGTARYVGMGGAMEALGADISTIGTNPAGIGLFRKSAANASFGFVSQQDGKSFANGNKTNMSFDQVGFVYAMKSGRNSFLNFAFNYHKSRNFDYVLSATSALSGGSQNKQSYIKGLLDNVDNGGFNVGKSSNGDYLGYVNSGSTNIASTFSQADYLYWNAFLVDPNSGDYGYNDANGYMFDRAHTGYIGEYDFNISGNIQDRVYLGMTVGIHDVHYKGYSEYTEDLVDATNQSVGSLTMSDERKITGTGVDIKAGVIFRPVEESPFRIALYVSTPTWYDLTTENYTQLINNTKLGAYDKGHSEESYDYKFYTPWKFGLSLGHTIGDYLALGASYEYADYGKIDNRYNDGSYYDDYYGGYYDSSSSDDIMNRHTDFTLKGVSTLKLGLEFKPDPSLAVRFGYNYVSPMYDKGGYKDSGLNSDGSYYASATDYTNWKSTNRITCGLGYTVNKFSFDLAYQYSSTTGDFYPFTNGLTATATDSNNQQYTISNNCSATKVNNKRHQVLFTLGYRF